MSNLPAVNVRELRQNLSKYLRRVAAGETLRVAERGRPVAILAPLPEDDSMIDRMVAQGLLTRPTRDLAALGPPPSLPTEMPLSEALAEQRSDKV